MIKQGDTVGVVALGGNCEKEKVDKAVLNLENISRLPSKFLLSAQLNPFCFHLLQPLNLPSIPFVKEYLPLHFTKDDEIITLYPSLFVLSKGFMLIMPPKRQKKYHCSMGPAARTK